MRAYETLKSTHSKWYHGVKTSKYTLSATNSMFMMVMMIVLLPAYQHGHVSMVHDVITD